jgi:hypothetical protein
MQTNIRIEKDGKLVGSVYVCRSMVVVKSVRTGKLQEFASVEELKRKLEPLGCKLVVSCGQLAELKELAN